MQIQDLIKKIKDKKELSGLSDSVVEDNLSQYLKKFSISPVNLPPKQIKIIVKEVRAKLRNISGQYQGSLKKRKKSLHSENFSEILKTHSSTSERAEFYPELKKIIEQMNVNSILDLGCGLNPLALASPEIKYYASDVKEDEVEIIRKFFKKNKIKGKTFMYDLTKIDNSLPKADLCLLLKVLDVVGGSSKNRGKLTKEIIEKIPCRNLIVSFATKKLSGKSMSSPKRFWFEKLLKKLNLNFRVFCSKNEMFYLIEK